MSAETRAILATVVGTGLVVAGLLAGVMYALIAGVNTRIDDMRAEMADMRADFRADMSDMRADMRDMRAGMAAFDARLDAVEVALGKVDQRLLTIERVVLPPAGRLARLVALPDSLLGWQGP